MLHVNRKPDVSSIKLSKASRYCDLQSQKWCLSKHVAWFKPLSTAVTVTRIPRSTLNLQWQLRTAEEMRIFCYSKIFPPPPPEKRKESIFFCNSFSTILKVVVSNKKTLVLNKYYLKTYLENEHLSHPSQEERQFRFWSHLGQVAVPFSLEWKQKTIG